jgi:hypothetical protein
MNQESKSTLSTPSSPFGKFLDREYCLMVRGLGMLAIVYGHTINEFMPFLEKYNLTSTLGLPVLGVAICFFLSGYGLTCSFASNIVDFRYILRHLNKILLPYLIFWIMWIGVGCALGTFPSEQNLFVSFMTLAMPNADAWFLKTIVVLYVIYMLLRWKMPGYERIIISLLIVAYIILSAYLGFPNHWWGQILCFPLGIAFSSISILRRKVSIQTMVLLLIILVALKMYGDGALMFLSVGTCILIAYLSTYVKYITSFIVWIGANSIYVYLMEAIPMDYMNSQEVGILVFVFGGIGITLVLSHFGRSIERFINRKVFNYSI